MLLLHKGENDEQIIALKSWVFSGKILSISGAEKTGLVRPLVWSYDCNKRPARMVLNSGQAIIHKRNTKGFNDVSSLLAV